MDADHDKKTFQLGGKPFRRVSWWREKSLQSLYIWLMFAVITSATNGYDGSMMNGLQALEQWRSSFKNPGPSTRGLLNAIMPVGSIVALLITPYIADHAGRRAGILLGCLLMILGVILQSVGANIAMFIAARFLIGFGCAVSQGSAPLLVAELAHPQHRAVFTTIYNSTWYFGSVIVAWVTFGSFRINNEWACRLPSAFQAVPSIIQFMAIWMVPESPRYLVARGSEGKARRILVKYHGRNDNDDDLVNIEFQEIHKGIQREKSHEGNGWIDLVRSPGNRRRLLIILTLGFFSQLSGNGLVSYYISDVLSGAGISESETQLEINGILMIVNLISAVGSSFFMDKLGRRSLFISSTAGMLVSFIAWTICAARFVQTGVKVAANAEVAFIFIFYLCYNLAWSGPMVGYAVEILPYKICAKGVTLLFLAIDLALFFNSYVNPIALGAMGWKYYIIYDVWLAIELVVVFVFYVETCKTPLEISKFFDKEDVLLEEIVAIEKTTRPDMEVSVPQEKPPVSSVDQNQSQ